MATFSWSIGQMSSKQQDKIHTSYSPDTPCLRIGSLPQYSGRPRQFNLQVKTPKQNPWGPSNGRMWWREGWIICWHVRTPIQVNYRPCHTRSHYLHPLTSYIPTNCLLHITWYCSTNNQPNPQTQSSWRRLRH